MEKQEKISKENPMDKHLNKLKCLKLIVSFINNTKVIKGSTKTRVINMAPLICRPQWLTKL